MNRRTLLRRALAGMAGLALAPLAGKIPAPVAEAAPAGSAMARYMSTMAPMKPTQLLTVWYGSNGPVPVLTMQQVADAGLMPPAWDQEPVS